MVGLSSNTFEDTVKLNSILADNIEKYRNTLQELNDYENDNTFNAYEYRINTSLELQFSASYILSIAYELQNSLKEHIF